MNLWRQCHVLFGTGRRGDRNGRLFGLEASALNDQTPVGDMGAQTFLLEIRFLHQPVSNPAQQLRIGAAVLESARPHPSMVAHDLRDAAFLDPVEDQ